MQQPPRPRSSQMQQQQQHNATTPKVAVVLPMKQDNFSSVVPTTAVSNNVATAVSGPTMTTSTTTTPHHHKKSYNNADGSKMPENGTTGMQVDLSTHMEVYSANQEHLLILPRADVIQMPPSAVTATNDAEGSVAPVVSTATNNQKQTIQLCPHFDSSKGDASCPEGARCKFVHAITDNATRHDIHINYAWASYDDVCYETFPVGTVLQVAPPNANVATDEIPSHLVLKTKALQSSRRVISHCAHYYFNRCCNRGAGCYFIHAISVTPARDAVSGAPLVGEAADPNRRVWGRTQQRRALNNNVAESSAPSSPTSNFAAAFTSHHQQESSVSSSSATASPSKQQQQQLSNKMKKQNSLSQQQMMQQQQQQQQASSLSQSTAAYHHQLASAPMTPVKVGQISRIDSSSSLGASMNSHSVYVGHRSNGQQQHNNGHHHHHHNGQQQQHHNGNNSGYHSRQHSHTYPNSYETSAHVSGTATPYYSQEFSASNNNMSTPTSQQQMVYPSLGQLHAQHLGGSNQNLPHLASSCEPSDFENTPTSSEREEEEVAPVTLGPVSPTRRTHNPYSMTKPVVITAAL